MIAYGIGKGRAVLGEAGRNECPSCKQFSAFNVVVDYKYFHIWYLFSLLIRREYSVVCANCQDGGAVSKETIRSKFPSDNIPFIRRNGWLVVLALAAVFLGMGAVGSWRRGEATRQWLADPRVGDVCLANLAKIEGSGFERLGNSYGAMKLIEIGDEFSFATTMQACDRKSNVDSELKTGGLGEYDVENPVYLTREELDDLGGRGIIYEVRRQG